MKTDTVLKITEFIAKKRQTTAKDLVDYLGISKQALFRHLARLIKNGEISKIGKPPKVFYYISEKNDKKTVFQVDPSIKQFIDQHYLFISPLGYVKEGFDGFSDWCNSRKQDAAKTAPEYVKTVKKYNSYKKEGGFIDGLPKAKKTFDIVSSDQLFYLDFYSIERFGKTKLGQLLLYAKQNQSRAFIKRLMAVIQCKIEFLIKKNNIDAVCFIPPTVKREVQFMNELKNNLNLKIPALSVVKVKTEVPIPQKTLNRLEDRVENAKRTIIVDEKMTYEKVLIIDDAIGSGATINETAKQIKEKGIAKTVIGLAITGSFKGFDVISEV